MQVLKEMQVQFPALPLMGIIEDFNHLENVNSIRFSQLALWHKLLSTSLLKKLKRQNTKVWTFTVDDPAAAKSMHEMGVHGIITNDPGIYFESFPSLRFLSEPMLKYLKFLQLLIKHRRIGRNLLIFKREEREASEENAKFF